MRKNSCKNVINLSVVSELSLGWTSAWLHSDRSFPVDISLCLPLKELSGIGNRCRLSAFFYRTCILQPRGVRWIIPFSDVHFFSQFIRPKGGSVAEWRCRVTVLGKLFTPIVHQAAKLVATLLRVAEVTAGLAESNDSLPPGLWLTSPAGWLPRTGISSGTVR